MNVAKWVGWVWDTHTGTWFSVCDSAELDACHRELLAYCKRHRIACKYTALTGGHVPGWRVE